MARGSVDGGTPSGDPEGAGVPAVVGASLVAATRGGEGTPSPLGTRPFGPMMLGSTFGVSAAGFSPTCSGKGVRWVPVGGMPYFCRA